MEQILRIEGVTKRFPGVVALNKVCFSLSAGSVHALCGENGAGKSTLMHVLAGVFPRDEGTIQLYGRGFEPRNQHHSNQNGIAMVYQERSLVDGLSVAENIFAARQPVNRLGFIRWRELNETVSAILKRLNMQINPNTLVGRLSPAQQQMVEIAKALSLNPRILILDEPTATITEKETEALFRLIRELKQEGVGIIYISHRLAEIFQIADEVSVLKDGILVETSRVSEVNSDWLVAKMVGRELLHVERHISPKETIALRCTGLTGRRFRNISFEAHKGEIISFAGLVGAGRTEVMRSIFGADSLQSGNIEVFGQQARISTPTDAIRHGIGYVPEDRKQQGLFLEMSVAENVVSASVGSMGKGVFFNWKDMSMHTREYIEKLNIVTSDIANKAVTLSGGNQQKVVLAKWLMRSPRILIVDEPTRGIDVGAKTEIYALLKRMAQDGTCIIVVSSDLVEVLAISQRIYVMHEGEITAELPGETTEKEIIRFASGIH